MADFTTSATFKSLWDTSDFEKGAQKVVSSSNQAADATDRVTESITKAGKSATLTADSYDKFYASIDRNAKAQNRAQSALSKLNDYYDAGIVTGKKYEDAVDSIANKYGGFRHSNDNATSGLELFHGGLEVGRAALGAFGIALSVEGFVEFAKSTFETTAHMVDLAEQARVNVEEFQAYRNILQQSGGSADDANRLLEKLTATLGQAQGGSTGAREAFQGLGLDWRKLIDVPISDVVQNVAGALLHAKDASTQAAAEVAFFGRSGQSITTSLPLLSQAIQDTIEKQKAAGLIFSQPVGEEAKKSLSGLETEYTKLKVAAAEPVTFVVKVVTYGLDLIKDNPFLQVPKGGWSPDNVSVTPQQQLPGHPVFDAAAASFDQSTQWASNSAAAKTYTELLKEATALAKDTGAQIDKIGTSTQALVGFMNKEDAGLGDETLKRIQHNVLAQQKLDLQAKTVNEYDNFLAKLKNESDLAGLTASQRQIENATIEAANALEKQRLGTHALLVTSYQQALTVLGQTKAAQVDTLAVELQKNTLQQSVLQPLRDQALLVGLNRDTRAQELDIIKLQTQYGAAFTEETEAEYRALQKRLDLEKANDNIADLKEQVYLAGLMPDIREREAVVLQQIHATHGNITADQKAQIANLITIRQELDRESQFTQSISGDFENFLSTSLEKGTLNFKTLWDSAESDFDKMLAHMIEQALLNPIIIPIITDLQKQLGGLGSGLGGLGSLFGGAGSSGQGKGGAGSGGSSGLLYQLGFGPNSLGGQALGGAFLGGTIGGFFGKGDSQIGGAIGGAIGQAIAGPIGGIVGGILGGFVGSLTGSTNHSSTVSFNADGSVGGVTHTGDSQTAAEASGIGQSIVAAMSALQYAGVQFNSVLQSINIGHDKSSYWIGGQKYSSSDTDPGKVAVDAIKQLLQQSTISDPNLTQVLNGNSFANVGDLTSAVNFVKNVFDVIASGRPALTDVEQQMKSLNDSLEQAAAQAKALGLSTTALYAGAAKSFNADTALAIEQIQNPLQAALDIEARNAQARLDEATQLGANIDLVKQFNDLERQGVLDQYKAQQTQQLGGLIGSIVTGNLSSQTDQQKYFSALTAYNQAVEAVRANQTDQTVQAFVAASQTLLPLAEAFLGQSASFGKIQSDILANAELFGGSAADPSGVGLQLLAATNSGNAALLQALQTQGETWDQIASILSSLSANLDAYLRKVA